jgi:predicted deacetylase
MSAFLISYSAATEYAAKNIDEFMDALEAVPIGHCLCGVEMDADLELAEFQKWLGDQLGDGDALVVIELRPHLAQASQNVSNEAAWWLAKMLSR